MTFPDTTFTTGTTITSEWLNAVNDKCLETVSVKDFGAVGDGVTDDTSAFTNACAASKVVVVPVGSYLLNTTPSYASTGNTLVITGGATLTGSGAPAYFSASAEETIMEVKSTSDEFATQFIHRNANHTGGTPGYVSSALKAYTEVGANVTNYEWAIVGQVRNGSTAGENVGVYGQGNMLSTGGTWGGVMEACDQTFTSSAGKSNLIGLEVDCYCNGADTSSNRFGLSIVSGDAQFNRQGTSGTAGSATYGILIQRQQAGATVDFLNGIVINSATQAAFQANSSGVRGFYVAGTYQIGLDTSGSTITNAAIRVGTGQAIAFDDVSTRQLKSNTSGQGGILYAYNGTNQIQLRDDGGIALNTARLVIAGTWSTGSQTPTLGANKPGSAGGTPAQWLSVTIDGSQFWVPAWSN